MRMYDIILKKRLGKQLSPEEINFFVEGFTNGSIPDYQASALLMAIMFVDMSKEEVAALTLAMAKSGDMIDLSQIQGIKVDKHSTGGVGDKVSLIVAPIVASFGIPVAKMSGRGLGHTGGTVDKLESIPGFKTDIEPQKFIKQVQQINLSIIGQSGNISPADKKLYALRDVTGTVDNISLIAASIMSKKLASGADAFVLDIKVGSGAFAKTLDWAKKLAEVMIDIARQNGKKARVILTNMDQPLGKAVGNWLEIEEVIDVLQNNGPADITKVSIEIAANMLNITNYGDINKCRTAAENATKDGTAFNKFKEMVLAQGGDTSVLDNPSSYPKNSYFEYKATKTGYIQAMDTQSLGIASILLGAGRAKKEDTINPSAGILFLKKINDYVIKDELIAKLYTNSNELSNQATSLLDTTITIGENKGKDIDLIYHFSEV